MQNLFSLYKDDSRLTEALNKLDSSSIFEFKQTNTSFDPIFIAQIAQKCLGTHIVVSSNHESAEELFHDLTMLKPTISLHFFESSLVVKNKTVHKSSSKENAQNLVIEAIDQSRDKLIITYPQAIVEKFMVSRDPSHFLKLKSKDRISIPSLIDYLENNGYVRESFVYEYGQYAIRGNIIDIYSYSYKNPVRLELFDVEIEEIRFFDIETQLSVEEAESIVVSMNPKLRNAKRSLCDLF